MNCRHFWVSFSTYFCSKSSWFFFLETGYWYIGQFFLKLAIPLLQPSKYRDYWLPMLGLKVLQKLTEQYLSFFSLQQLWLNTDLATPPRVVHTDPSVCLLTFLQLLYFIYILQIQFIHWSMPFRLAQLFLGHEDHVLPWLRKAIKTPTIPGPCWITAPSSPMNCESYPVFLLWHLSFHVVFQFLIFMVAMLVINKCLG